MAEAQPQTYGLVVFGGLVLAQSTLAQVVVPTRAAGVLDLRHELVLEFFLRACGRALIWCIGSAPVNQALTRKVLVFVVSAAVQGSGVWTPRQTTVLRRLLLHCAPPPPSGLPRIYGRSRCS